MRRRLLTFRDLPLDFEDSDNHRRFVEQLVVGNVYRFELPIRVVPHELLPCLSGRKGELAEIGSATYLHHRNQTGYFRDCLFRIDNNGESINFYIIFDRRFILDSNNIIRFTK